MKRPFPQQKKEEFCFLKRRIKERWINNYNPEMLHAWNANMDIQLALDTFSIITYIVSYMNKDETNTTKFLKEALNSVAKNNASEKLKILKMTYLTHRQVGVAEATYRILPRMKLKDSNIGCIFLSTGFPESRSRFYKKVIEDDSKIDETHNEDKDNDEIETDYAIPDVGKKPEKIAGKEGYYIEATTVHDHYAARPISYSPEVEGKLERLCLAQFATSYPPINKLPKNILMDKDGCLLDEQQSFQKIFNSDIYLPKYISLNDELGFMRLRTYTIVLRIHSSKRKEGHEQHYSELLLFSHWRNETEDFHRLSPEECLAEYERRKECEINLNRTKMFPVENIIELADIGDLKPDHVFDTLDCQGEQENLDGLAAGCIDDPEFESFGYVGNLKQNTEPCKGNFGDFNYKKIAITKTAELNEMSRKLVPEQMNVLRKVVSSCKTIVKAKNNQSVKHKPVRMIVHGGAGVGKSATIRAMSTQAENILRNASAGDNPDCPKVLLCAFTAKAANIIGGITFHSALSFKIGTSICHMNEKTRAKLRLHFSDLKLLIIDEVSMVGADMLYRIHLRLCEILQMDEMRYPFGYINVVLVGDLLQLPPVMGHQVFDKPKTQELKAYHGGLGNNSLWQQFEPMILKQNHRQGEAKEWIETLNRLREGIVTPEDEALLRTRLTKDDFLLEEAFHIFYFNQHVTEHNLTLSYPSSGKTLLPVGGGHYGPPYILFQPTCH